MKKNYQKPTFEVVEAESITLLAGSASTQSADEFLDEIQNDVQIVNPLDIL